MSRLLELPQDRQLQSRDELPQEHHFPPRQTFKVHFFFGAINFFVNTAQHYQDINNKGPQARTTYGSQELIKENAMPNITFHENNQNVKGLIPLPDWPVALNTWGISWELHIYGFSVLYLMLTGLSVVIFLRFRLRVQRFKIVYNTLILLATSGIFRAVFMLVDAYGYRGHMAGLMVGIMTQAVYPLLCACYGLTQVMLIRMTNVDVGHSRLRTLSCILGCTLTYLFVVVVIETLVFYQRSIKLLLLLDSGCFIAWSLCLGITFICSGFRLTQYATETKRAQKELNAFCNHRRSVSNATALSAISNISNDASFNLLSYGITSASSPDTIALSPTKSYAFLGDARLLCSSPTFATPGCVLPASSHRSTAQVRLSRPRLRISDQNHMTVTIATDDDDEETSSTDADRPRSDSAPKRVRRFRKSSKQKKHRRFRNRSRSSTPTSSYRPVSVIDDSCSSKMKRSTISGSDNEAACNTVAGNYSLITCTETPDCTAKAYTKPQSALSSTTCVSEQHKNMHLTISDTLPSELTLLEPSSAQPELSKRNSKFETNDSLDEEGDEEEEVDESYQQMSASWKCVHDDFLSRASHGISQVSDRNHNGNIPVDLLCISEHPSDNTLESNIFSAPTDNDQISSSLRENGYLADTENIFSCTTFSRFGSSLRRKLKTPSNGHAISQKSSPSHSDDDSPTSPVLPERPTTNMSASLSLFRIRQSSVVLRAVHLTYFLTFLFMFACLLQLYTVFGVYGVLGTIPTPDPWPWLIFHTIFRATEVSIGLTIAAIAFTTLNYRHQRAKRRHQQQQHLDATRDCIV